ncbi:MAG: PaREP1 family protein [Candidatus Bathyarchaeia archaeon]
MAKSREDLVDWSLQKAEEYLQSAQANLEANRLFPAAEEIFRSVESTLEALLYYFGVRRIEYPGKKKKFTGRLALQFLIRDNLVKAGRLEREVYNEYLILATELHRASYQPSMTFNKEKLVENLQFAEDLLTRAKSIAMR